MKLFALVQLCIFSLFVYIADCLPVETNDVTNTVANKPVFGAPFDEIVVDTSLVVRRKNPNRQSRNNDNKN
ncbi:unnamed protein product [Callosobruchus maculatus]|nr:unnamed protein product [Callosobruchus maculatus]